MKPHNLRENGQQPATPLRYTAVYGEDGIHAKVPQKELAEVLTGPFSTIYQQSWLTGEVSVRLEVSKCDTRRAGKRIQRTTGLSA